MCLPLLGIGAAAGAAAGASTILGGIASLAGTAVSVIGAMQSANAQAQQANYQAAVAHNNAIIAQRNAIDARNRGAADEERQRMKTAALIGRQTAAMAANGLDLSQGSPLDVLGDTAAAGELDALTIRNTYEREAISDIAQMNNFNAEEELQHMKADSAQSAGAISALGGAFSGLASFSNKWYGGSTGSPLRSSVG